MKPLNIHFLGSKENYSKLVKKDLITAGYQLVADPKESDLIITASYGQIIPPSTLKLPQHGALNIHPSLLPKYRGAAPVPWTLLNQETQTGVTIFKMDSGIDTGPILAQKKTTIKPHETAEDLLNRLFKLGTQILIKLLPDYIEHKISPIPQPVKSPTLYARKLTKQDGFISFKDFIQASKADFSSVNYKIRALYPWPGVWTKMPASPSGGSSQKTLKLLPSQQAGLPKNLIQLEGKSPITWKQFKNGYQHLLK